MLSDLERGILVYTPEFSDMEDLETIQHELRELAITAGVEVIEEVVQRRRGNRHFLGKGKTDEIAEDIVNQDIQVTIFNDPLSPSEMRFMEERLNCKVLDRNALILDIFAQRARTREGKLQVELAQLTWLLPRLMGKGTELSRLGGGVGTRGPGETKLETDRRHIRRRIHHVKTSLDEVVAQRKQQSAARRKLNCPYVVLVGYTNAGKSSLLNRLAASDVYVADQLFATLDPTTRRVVLPSNNVVFMSDTVGFIRELPPHLSLAFKATLEILRDADLLIHVIDVSQNNVDERIAVVDKVLSELDCGDIPRLHVFNKIDSKVEYVSFASNIPRDNCLYLSAQTGIGVDELVERLEQLAAHNQFAAQIRLVHSQDSGRLLALAYAYGEVEKFNSDEHAVSFYVKGDYEKLKELAQYIDGTTD